MHIQGEDQDLKNLNWNIISRQYKYPKRMYSQDYPPFDIPTAQQNQQIALQN